MKRDHLCTRNPRGIYESLIEVLAAAPILVLVRGFRTYIGISRFILHLGRVEGPSRIEIRNCYAIRSTL